MTTPVTSSDRGRLFQPLDGNPAESMEGEFGLEGFVAIAAHDVRVRRFCLFEIRHVKRAVGVEPLGVLEGDCRTLRAPHRDPGHTSDVLSQVVNEDSRGGLRHLHRLHFPDDSDRLILRRDQIPTLSFHHRCGWPARIVVARFVPSGLLQPGVVLIAILNIGRRQRSRAGLPRAIGRHDLRGTIREFQMEFRRESHLLPYRLFENQAILPANQPGAISAPMTLAPSSAGQSRRNAGIAPAGGNRSTRGRTDHCRLCCH